MEDSTDKGRFHDVVWLDYSKQLTARDVRRYVQLAGVLEPLSEKPGCTTRTKDLPGQKLEYFVTAAVNIGDVFEDLANRLHHGFPQTTYDLAYRAQADSKKNRRGGRTNQGIIEFLFPLVITQCVNQSPTLHALFDYLPDIMQQTTSEDTFWLQQMQNLAFAMSGYYHRAFSIMPAANIPTYYTHRLVQAEKPSDLYHNREMVENYPTLQKMFTMQVGGPLSERMAILYSAIKNGQSGMPCGMIADLVACYIYLEFSYNRQGKIIS